MTSAIIAGVFFVHSCLWLSASPQEFREPHQAENKFEKIDRKVRAQAATGGLIPVFILLVHQPQAEIYRRTQARHASRLSSAQEWLRSAAVASVAELSSAVEAQNAAILDIRKEAFEEIDQSIRPVQDTMEARLRGMGAQNIQRYSLVTMMAADIPSSAIDALERDEMVGQVSLITQTGMFEANEKNLDAIHVDAFWEGTPQVTGIGQTVALLDTGVSNRSTFDVDKPVHVSIPDFVFLYNAARIVYPDGHTGVNPCFEDSLFDGQDFVGHGTETASVIASRQDGYLGVARGLSGLLNFKIGYRRKADDRCPVTAFDPQDFVEAVQWATRPGHQLTNIFNFSAGFFDATADDFFARLIDRAIDSFGLAFVISAGNEGKLTSPGNAYNGITVAAWDVKDREKPIPDWSGRGSTADGRKKPDIAAPGMHVAVATLHSRGVASGTSIAAPHVTGALALLSQFGVTDQLRAKALLINSADRPPEKDPNCIVAGTVWDRCRGWGYLDLKNLREQAAYPELSPHSVSSAQSYAFYVGPGSSTDPHVSTAGLDATLVWNRQFPKDPHYANGFTNNLDLLAYGRDAGNRVTQSNSSVDNVEFVHLFEPGEVVLKVRQTGVWPTDQQNQEFRLAVSLPNYDSASGPRLSVTCPDGPQDLSKPWTCTITNDGDLPAFNVTVTHNGGEMQFLGTIEAGKNNNQPATWTLPATGGKQVIDARSTSYDEQFVGSGTFNPVPAGCNLQATPNVLIVNPKSTDPIVAQCHAPYCQVAYGYSGSIQVTVNSPSCPWTASVVPGTPGVPLPTVAPASGAGSGTLTWTAPQFACVSGPNVSMQAVAVQSTGGGTGVNYIQYCVPGP
jgi:hypothetical protein